MTQKSCKIHFFTGVPDSYLNGFCYYALENRTEQTIIAANEGNAIGIAAGHFFATGEIPLVYLQNSGLGISVNPLVCLADKGVYAVPMILLIGWRGQGNTEPKHPQHQLQGEINPCLLEIMHIPYTVLEDDDEHFSQTIEKAVAYCREKRQPYGLIAPKGVMAASDKPIITDDSYPMSREEAIDVILNQMPKDTIYTATTGRATRELFFLRKRRGEGGECDFLNVGSMGHVSSVALGIALARPKRQVVVLDGDSACLMHMGTMSMVSKVSVPNYMHIVLNNGAHESVGGQPSAGQNVDFSKIAEGCGYITVGHPVTSSEELADVLKMMKDMHKACFIDVWIHKGLNGKLPPLDFDHREAIDKLMKELEK